MGTTVLPASNKTGQPVTNVIGRADMGTFKDSLRSPVHRWFSYPAGFSPRAVEEAIREYGLKPGHVMYDPFVGTGTTQIVTKQRGIDSIGVEAHPFVYEIARIKLFWEFDYQKLGLWIERLEDQLARRISTSTSAEEAVNLLPLLVRNCFDRHKLGRLYEVRMAIEELTSFDQHFRDFCWLALVGMLRKVADVETGWPYIAPKKPLKTNGNKDVLKVFSQQLRLMKGDLEMVGQGVPPCLTRVIRGDARKRIPRVEQNSIDFAFTSPPYLNNYDYADRTRLETYFFGICSSWRDISEQIRSKLITAATTQVRRNGWSPDTAFGDGIRSVDSIYSELLAKTKELSAIRLQKGGRKYYDVVVAGYFNDMYQAMAQTAKLLKPGATFIMILGDSAPYGVFVPTERYLGEIGLSVGFSGYRVDELRRRGGKWKKNPQRHNVALRESLLILKK